MNTLPLGFAQQVLDLQIKLQEEQSLQIIQILTQMYKLAVDYYLNVDDSKKAMFFQKKLNMLVVKSLHAPSVQQPKKNKEALGIKIKKQIGYYQQCQKTVVRTMVQNNQKIQKKIKKHYQDDLQKQQESLKNRMLRRVKSTHRFL